MTEDEMERIMLEIILKNEPIVLFDSIKSVVEITDELGRIHK